MAKYFGLLTPHPHTANPASIYHQNYQYFVFEFSFLLFIHSFILRMQAILATHIIYIKANVRDLIAATGLVISNWIQIVDFSACLTLKFDGSPQKKK